MIRTVTYDDSTHKIVPREATEKMVSGALSGRILPQSCDILKRVRQSTKADLESAIEAAPEYQEPVKTMVCHRCGADRFKEPCKQQDINCPITATALGSPDYQEPTKDE